MAELIALNLSFKEGYHLFLIFKYFFVSKLMLIVTCLLRTAFFTLFERKIMGLSHFRKGPNKIRISGFLQPFGDVVKLMSKNEDYLKITQILIFFLNPFFILFLSMIFWITLFSWGRFVSMKFSFFLFIILSSINIFFLLCTGWVSGSFYRILGRYRATAQIISYEGIFFLIFITIAWVSSQIRLKNFFFFNKINFNYLAIICFFFLWKITILAETNRTPFDFSEGERELVSGFNTEYSRGLFSIIFLGEYMNILFFCFLTSFLLGGNSLLNLFVLLITCFVAVLIRCCYPRFRYDFLILWSWKFIIFARMPILIYFYFFNNF